jgi:CRP-like cAMP-binding protein
MYELLRRHFNKYVQLSEEEFQRSVSYFTHKKFRKHQYILQAGEISRFETYILSGCTRIFEVDDQGREHILQFGVEDWWVGDMYSFLTVTRSNLNIDCVEDTEVLQITLENQDRLCSDVPQLERHFRKLVQHAYCASIERISSNLSKPALQRYEDFIRKYPHIGERIPNHYIASYLGIAPQSLSRLRSQRAGKGG